MTPSAHDLGLRAKVLNAVGDAAEPAHAIAKRAGVSPWRAARELLILAELHQVVPEYRRDQTRVVSTFRRANA